MRSPFFSDPVADYLNECANDRARRQQEKNHHAGGILLDEFYERYHADPAQAFAEAIRRQKLLLKERKQKIEEGENPRIEMDPLLSGCCLFIQKKVAVGRWVKTAPNLNEGVTWSWEDYEVYVLHNAITTRFIFKKKAVWKSRLIMRTVFNLVLPDNVFYCWWVSQDQKSNIFLL